MERESIADFVRARLDKSLDEIGALCRINRKFPNDPKSERTENGCDVLAVLRAEFSERAVPESRDSDDASIGVRDFLRAVRLVADCHPLDVRVFVRLAVLVGCHDRGLN